MRTDRLGTPEDIDHVDGFWDRGEIRIARQSLEAPVVVRVHANDVKVQIGEEARHPVAWPARIIRAPDDGPSSIRAQDSLGDGKVAEAIQ